MQLVLACNLGYFVKKKKKIPIGLNDTARIMEHR